MDNPFKKIFGNLVGELTPKSKSVFALDLGFSSAKVVQLRNDRGRVVLETYGELATGPYGGLAVGQATNLSIEKTAEMLKDLMREASVTATIGAIAIPLRSSLIMTIEVPDLGKARLAEMVPIEARKYVPVPITEVMLDWWVVPKQFNTESVEKIAIGAGSQNKMIEVLVAAIHRDTIQQYTEISGMISVKPSFFEIETFSEIRSTLRNDLSPTVILDIGAGTSKMTIVDYGIVRVSHTINKGSQDITMAISRSMGLSFAKAEEIKRQVGLTGRVGMEDLENSVSPIIEYIFAEVNRVMINYEKRFKRSVSKVVLLGGGALMKGLTDIAKKSIEIPVTVGTPFDKVEAPAFLTNILTESGPSFAVAIGLALRALEEN